MENTIKKAELPIEQGKVMDDAGDRNEQWDRVLNRLKIECGENVFNSWFGRLELERVSPDVAEVAEQRPVDGFSVDRRQEFDGVQPG